MKRLTYLFSATAAFAAIASYALWAQAQSPEDNDSRLPKGIRGLEEGQAGPPDANWLLGAKDDEERFRRLQIYAGGTDQQMWQIGYRYEEVYQAIIGEHWELAEHHWGKLRAVLNVALMKRPNRTPNAEAMFLDENWQVLADAIKAKNIEQAREAFLLERTACMSCHIAEGYEFINDTSIFKETESFPGD